jgi:transcriptional regulator with XRE-family HTH domain
MGRTSSQQKLGKRLRELRNAKGWSQERLSIETKVDRSYISEIERGTRNPSLTTLSKLAKALDISVADLTSF